MDLKKELSEYQAMLLLMPSIEYNELIVRMAKQLSGESVCYVTLNKTYDSLRELFEKNKVDLKNMVFIDAISRTIKQTPEQTEGCFFVSSPGALTEISLVVSTHLKHNFRYLVFDSLTNLLVYEKKAPVARFVSSLVNKIKESKTRAVFYALKMEQHEELIEEASMFVDRVIDLRMKG